MNDPSRRITIDSTSLVGLKAELGRKQKEFQEKRNRAHGEQLRPLKTKVKAKKLKEDGKSSVSKSDDRDLEEKIEEAQKIADARKILEKKALLYEDMVSGKVDDDGENLLVDFHQKEVIRQQEASEKQSSKENEPWESTVRLKGDRAGFGVALEENDQSDQLKIHYSDIQHNEKRAHGVGYYQLAGNEETRKAQLALLERLRTQTLENKSKKEKIKQKRKAIMEERLRKMRKRRGLPEPAPKEEEIEEKPVEPEPLERDDEWRKTVPITREWDKGKTLMEDYETQCRNERNPDFAPPSFYQEESEYVSPNTHQNQKPPVKQQPKKKKQKGPKKPKASNDISAQLRELRSVVENESSYLGDGNSMEEMDVSSIPLPPDPDQSNIASANVANINSMYDNSVPADNSQGQPGFDQGANPMDIPLPPPAPPPPPMAYPFPPPGFPFPPPSTVPSYPPPNYTHPLQHPPPGLPPGLVYPPYTYPLPTDAQPQPDPTHGWDYIKLNDSDIVPPGTGTVEHDSLQQQSGLEQAEQTVVTQEDSNNEPRAAPQPAHYSSGPQKVQAPAPRYERVHFHTVPLTLPAPPTASNVPNYSAQGATFIPFFKDRKGEKKDMMHMWNKQFQQPNKKT